MLNVAVINGGRGASGLISAFLERPYINLTSIVNAYDDGKSTGEIRKFFDNAWAFRFEKSSTINASC